MDEGSPRHWIGVVSRQHVLRGVAGGFAQLGHGTAAPLRRMAVEAPIAPLIGSLDFIPDKKRWGFPFRRGILTIGAADFARIAAAMQVEAD
jgi:hypothetical protein